ncbi:MAG: DUF2752 domain-containing protein [Verrucomicrobiota bacterium]|nr:DUF2752 domain-containing protein [Verrucomicrobiota bacterium]
MKTPLSKNYFQERFFFVGSAAAGLILFLFDPAQFPFYPRCLFHSWTGLSCPGCGSLRAAHQLLHGNFAAAFHLNSLFIISIPFLAIAFFSYARKMTTGQSLFKKNVPSFWIWLFLVVLIVFTIARNLPSEMWAWMSA